MNIENIENKEIVNIDDESKEEISNNEDINQTSNEESPKEIIIEEKNIDIETLLDEKKEIIEDATEESKDTDGIIEDKQENETEKGEILTGNIEEINVEQIKEDNIPEDRQENDEQKEIINEEIKEKIEEEAESKEEEEIKENVEKVEEEKAEEKQESEYQEKPSWYIIHTYSGHEYKVKERIEQRSQAMNITNKITKVIVPEEESVEIKNNKRQEKTNKMFPGYVFVEMVLDNETWFLIRKIPGVSKFLGPKSMPLPVTEKEMLRVLQQTGVKTKKIEVDFEIGELIKVISGPFRGYQGGINEIFPDRGKLKAKISIFGRETPVELDFDQVEKVIK